ncbi:uracil-DNA glycosylase [bacterium]|jgi:uracil-DNA glycosylase family 4|nr:uracil-DNA glycosylase [bacterium]
MKTQTQLPKLEQIHHEVTECKKCPRLRKYCGEIAQLKRKSFQGDTYWGKPVPGFGDPEAELYILGLAPAAHGANRTGRIFTGDRSGEWLYRTLFDHGFSSQIQSQKPGDGLRLLNTYISCIVKCAPPQNKPTPQELKNCSHFLQDELHTLKSVKVYIVLGQMAYQALWRLLKPSQKRPLFQHGLKINLDGNRCMILSYHPSQQNTFTGKLTHLMFHSVFQAARSHLQDNNKKNLSF